MRILIFTALEKRLAAPNSMEGMIVDGFVVDMDLEVGIAEKVANLSIADKGSHPLKKTGIL